MLAVGMLNDQLKSIMGKGDPLIQSRSIKSRGHFQNGTIVNHALFYDHLVADAPGFIFWKNSYQVQSNCLSGITD
jgi:hypothetical protein